jgi:hypothetical protein
MTGVDFFSMDSVPNERPKYGHIINPQTDGRGGTC